jgi:hypothetical protein
MVGIFIDFNSMEIYMAKQLYENWNPNDLNFITRFECGNEEKRRWKGYLSSEKSDTDITRWKRRWTKLNEEKRKGKLLTLVNTRSHARAFARVIYICILRLYNRYNIYDWL